MTHPNTDQGVTAEVTQDTTSHVLMDRRCQPARSFPELAFVVGLNDVAAMIDQARLSSTAALEAEIAFLKQRLESAEAMARLVTEYDHDRGCGGRCYSCECGYDERVCDAATTFLQEQEKQNG